MAENPNQKQIDKLKKQFAKNANDKKGGDPKETKESPLRLLLGLHCNFCPIHRDANL
jgi:hypothetical protein